jgi:hypothetical protein
MSYPERYVSYDRWEAEHAALARRVTVLEQFADRLSGAEQEHRSMNDAIADLQSDLKEAGAAEHARRDRQWLIAMALLSGIVLPLILTTVLTWLHVKALG